MLSLSIVNYYTVGYFVDCCPGDWGSIIISNIFPLSVITCRKVLLNLGPPQGLKWPETETLYLYQYSAYVKNT
jgi:hypothetical protein